MHIDTESATRRQTAAAMGVSETTIGAWFAAGCPRGPKGRYSLPAVVKWRMQRLQADRPTSEKLDKETLRYRRAKAKKIEMEVAVQEGKLVYREAVTRSVMAMIVIAKTKLLALPSEIGNQLSGSVDRETLVEITGIAGRVINQALHELSIAKGPEE